MANIKQGLPTVVKNAASRSPVSVGNDLYSAKQAADFLETDVETIRRMVVEDKKLNALVMCRAGRRRPLQLAGLFAHTVSDDCTVIDLHGRDAGSLRFDIEDLLPFRASVVNSNESMHRLEGNEGIAAVQSTMDSASATVATTNGTAVVWTAERTLKAKTMLENEKARGTKAYAATTAKEFGVSPARLRQVLADKPQKEPAKKAATLWSGLAR